ncbi:hypothetical protein F5B22DRAFT_25919 [Xylaria bambusicola]|uniref:uncharacterized protein n=1 Tax=Xylaria bambusicola TaxID=326684 RepID=UPI0020083706|nr:uncharacterized protein F5B22DRAFT_25919 [Xylaria bambusicola]KAI0528195.1 hypothetical protein F5B22DRAFT_25919 [Xylaria bambusicola]
MRRPRFGFKVTLTVETTWLWTCASCKKTHPRALDPLTKLHFARGPRKRSRFVSCVSTLGRAYRLVDRMPDLANCRDPKFPGFGIRPLGSREIALCLCVMVIPFRFQNWDIRYSIPTVCTDFAVSHDSDDRAGPLDFVSAPHIGSSPLSPVTHGLVTMKMLTCCTPSASIEWDFRRNGPA